MASTTKPLVCVVLALLVASTIPTASASPHDDPEDIIQQAISMTIDYVADFDPNDNITTQQEKAEAFIMGLQELISETICRTFEIGLDLPSINYLGVVDQRISVSVPAWGTDDETGETGVGMLTLDVGVDISCYDFITGVESPVDMNSIPVDVPEVWLFARKFFGISAPLYS